MAGLAPGTTYYVGVRANTSGSRRITDEPTVREVERDTNALLRGSKDGQVTIINESDRVIKGKRVIIDNVVAKPRRGGKIVEWEDGK